MLPAVSLHGVTKRFRSKVAIDHLSLEIGPRKIVGLIGQNGSGKTTLLDLIAGIAIPSAGRCETLGKDSGRLDETILQQLGVVFQENRFLGWMRVEQHLTYFGSFYDTWDCERQSLLLELLDLDPKAKVGHLSGGDAQKLGIITAVCHHPKLLLLDEPLSSLDPLARESVLKLILRLFDEDELTVIVSSHTLLDVERLVNWVVCLDQGELRANEATDTLQERFAEWHLVTRNGAFIEPFREPFVRDQSSSGRHARLVVENADSKLEAFRERYQADITVSRLNLEKIYPFLLKGRK